MTIEKFGEALELDRKIRELLRDKDTAEILVASAYGKYFMSDAVNNSIKSMLSIGFLHSVIDAEIEKLRKEFDAL